MSINWDSRAAIRNNFKCLPARQLRLLICAWARWLVEASPAGGDSVRRLAALDACVRWALTPTYENKNKSDSFRQWLNATHRQAFGQAYRVVTLLGYEYFYAVAAVASVARANYGTTLRDAEWVFPYVKDNKDRAIRSFHFALGPPDGFNPAWRTETAAALARGIIADRAFDRLPILADALEEAGLDHAPTLQHFRQGVHEAELSDWPLWHLALTPEFPEKV